MAGDVPTRWRLIPLLTGIDRDHALRSGLTGYLAALRSAGGPSAPPVPPDLRGDHGDLLRHRRGRWTATVPFLSRAG